MKHLKLYEGFEKFKKGEYVWVSSDYYKIENVPCIIDAKVDEDLYIVTTLDNTIIDGEINSDELTKMTDVEEASFKYNL